MTKTAARRRMHALPSSKRHERAFPRDSCTVFMLGYVFGRLPRRADRAVRRARRALVGMESEGLRVESVFHYGAVSLDPRNLVVWLLRSGKPDEEIPEWLEVTPHLRSELRQQGIDFDWLLHLRSLVVHEFARVSWPDPESVDVMVESEHRVKTQGGWNYFR